MLKAKVSNKYTCPEITIKIKCKEQALAEYEVLTNMLFAHMIDLCCGDERQAETMMREAANNGYKAIRGER